MGSEIAQGLLPNGRDFDPYDVLANVLGSLCAVGAANWYHKRAAERRRKAKYSALAGEEGDLELGEGPGLATDELGRGPEREQVTGTVAVPKTVEEELDNWDENIPDEAWDEEDEGGANGEVKVTPATSEGDGEEVPQKKVAVD